MPDRRRYKLPEQKRTIEDILKDRREARARVKALDEELRRYREHTLALRQARCKHLKLKASLDGRQYCLRCLKFL